MSGPLCSGAMTVEEETILDEATDNLLEALQRIKVTRNRL